MKIRMTDAELALFRSFLECCRTYVEFGAGGSTYLAASMRKEAIVSVDSSDEWLAKVKSECAVLSHPPNLHLIKVDIGPTGDWGVPLDPSARNRWPDYYTTLWNNPISWKADLVLVDGRFRVASFMSALLNCFPGTIVLMHDFAPRPHYHVVKEVSLEIARAESLSAFRLSNNVPHARIRTILDAHAFDAS